MFTSKPIREAVANGKFIPGYNYTFDTSSAPYDFHGSMTECCIQADKILLSEAVGYREYKVHAEALLSEAYANNSPAYQVLSESVFETLKAKAVMFFKKAYQVVLGIINKIKAFVFKLTGKTSKWLEAMTPRIEEGSRQPSFQSAVYQMKNWDTRYVTGDMVNAIDVLHKAWMSKCVGYIKDPKELQEIKKSQSGMSQQASAEMQQDQMSQNNPLTGDMQKIRADLQNAQASMPAEVGKAFKVSVNGRSMDDVWNNVVLRAQGGSDQAVEVPLATKLPEMMTAVQNAGKMLDELANAYGNHAKTLKTWGDGLERESASVESSLKSGAGIPQDAGDNIAAYVRAKYDFAITMTREYESAMSRGNALITQMVQSMVQEYIGALAKVASIRG